MRVPRSDDAARERSTTGRGTVAVLHNLGPGGAHRRLSEQIRHLGYPVAEVCLATATPVTGRPVIVPYGPRAPRWPRPVRPPLRYADALALWRAWRRAAAAAEATHARVVFVNSCQELHAPAALLGLRLPTLYFCDETRRIDYEPDAAAALNPTTRGLYRPLYGIMRRLDRAAMARAGALATVSRYSAGQIAAAYGRGASVVPMGVPDGFAPLAPSGSPSGSPRPVLSVGTLIPDKGHELVILAAAAAARSGGVRRAVELIAPRPHPAEEARLRGVAGAAGVGLRVRVGISDDELRRAYQRAQVICYLARAEPLGLASLEAQACGCPAIVSREGGLPETIGEGETGWSVDRHPESVARRILVLDEPALRARMAAAAAARGAAASWAVSGRVVRSLLEDLCAPARSGAPR